MVARPNCNPTVVLAQTNATRRLAFPTTAGTGRRKARGRGLVLRRKGVGTPTAGRTPAWAWAGDVAFNSTAGERPFGYAQGRPLFCMGTALARRMQQGGPPSQIAARLFRCQFAMSSPNLTVWNPRLTVSNQNLTLW